MLTTNYSILSLFINCTTCIIPLINCLVILRYSSYWKEKSFILIVAFKRKIYNIKYILIVRKSPNFRYKKKIVSLTFENKTVAMVIIDLE